MALQSGQANGIEVIRAPRRSLITWYIDIIDTLLVCDSGSNRVWYGETITFAISFENS